MADVSSAFSLYRGKACPPCENGMLNAVVAKKRDPNLFSGSSWDLRNLLPTSIIQRLTPLHGVMENHAKSTQTPITHWAKRRKHAD